MWRWIPRVIGCLLIPPTLLVAFLATWFRFDSYDEYQWALRMDVKIGFVFAVGVALIGVPPVGRNTLRWRVGWATASLLAWVLMSGGLAADHYHQHLVRSTPPGGELPWIVQWL